MSRPPSTFALVLSLLALALLVALSLVAVLSTRAGLHALSETYARLIVSTATTADALSSEPQAASAPTLETLSRAGVHLTTQNPPQPLPHRLTPMLDEVGRAAGRMLGDPSRVVITPVPDAQIWIRSVRDPRRWIVMEAASYRRQVIRSSLLFTVLGGLVALIVAALAARLLTRPLERLSAHAGELLAGAPMQRHLRGSPREVRQLAHAIGEAGNQLRLAARERELMLAGISHDLRTPLARLRLALELGDAGDAERRGAMVTDLEELDSALEQCLAFVRDGSNEARRETDLGTLLGQLLALRDQPDNWSYDGPDTALATVRPSLLRRALGNLMDNAEKYGAAPFRLVLRLHPEQLVLQVEDCGPGVDDELLGRLGRPFVRGDLARGGPAGTGLGLSIARRAADLDGGSLQLGHRVGGGFVATLVLPQSPRRR